MRNVPDLDITLLSIFNRRDDVMTPDRYHEVMENTEIRNEVTMLKLFEKLNIQASVKSDRYSLPYHKEIEHTNYGAIAPTNFTINPWDILKQKQSNQVLL